MCVWMWMYVCVCVCVCMCYTHYTCICLPVWAMDWSESWCYAYWCVQLVAVFTSCQWSSSSMLTAKQPSTLEFCLCAVIIVLGSRARRANVASRFRLFGSGGSYMNFLFSRWPFGPSLSYHFLTQSRKEKMFHILKYSMTIKGVGSTVYQLAYHLLEITSQLVSF